MKQLFSQRWQLIKPDLKRIAIGAGIALLGALATYLESAIPSIDFGQWTPIIVAVNAIIINTIRKFTISTVYVK